MLNDDTVGDLKMDSTIDSFSDKVMLELLVTTVVVVVGNDKLEIIADEGMLLIAVLITNVEFSGGVGRSSIVVLLAENTVVGLWMVELFTVKVDMNFEELTILLAWLVKLTILEDCVTVSLND